MRLGLLARSGDRLDLLDRALTLLAGALGCDRVYLLGDRPGQLARVLEARERTGDDDLAELVVDFVSRGGAPAGKTLAERADALFGAPVFEVSRGTDDDKLLDVWAGRIVVAVADKDHLGRDDIANAAFILHGDGDRGACVVIGSRAFLTPGPLGERQTVAVLALHEGRFVFEVCDLRGACLERHDVALRRTTKMRVV